MPVNTHASLDRVQYQKPQVNLARTTAARMWLVSLCAFMVVIQSSLGDSFASLILAVCAVVAAILTEFFLLYFKSGRAKALKDGSAVASALIFTLLLPNTISPFYAVAGAVFAMAVVKHSFGGLGSNWLNPAAGGWLFVRFSWPDSFPSTLEASPLSLLLERFRHGVSTLGESALGGNYLDYTYHGENNLGYNYLDYNNFSYAIDTIDSVGFSGEFIELFVSPLPGIIADRGNLLLLMGIIVLMVFRVNRFWIPLVYLTVFGVLLRFLPYGSELWNGDVLFALSSGGTLAAAFFLVNDPVTGAKSNGGILLATVLGGALTFFFRFYGAEPYGAFFAVVFVNAMLPLVRVFERHKLYERFSS